MTDELDTGRLIWVRLFEMHDKAKGAVLKRGISRTYDDRIPVRKSAFHILEI